MSKRKKRFVQYVCEKEEIEFCDVIKNVEIIWMRDDCGELFNKMTLHEMVGIVYISFEYKDKAEDVVLKVTRVK